MYKNYIFDLYGTLVDLATDENKDEVWKNLTLFYSYNGAFYEKEELKANYFGCVAQKIAKNTKTKYPDIKIEKVFKKLYSQKKIIADKTLIDATVRLFRGLSTESICVYKGVLELLIAIKKRGGKCFILSNGQKEFSVPELKYLGIYEYFESVYFSGDYGICKPDIRFFEALIEKEGLNRRECIMIGNDHTTDILGANNSELDSIYIHTNYSKKEAVIEGENGIVLSGVVNSTYGIANGDHYKIIEILKLK